MGNLLAVVHCDGGHHRAEHGSKNSTDDAIKIVNNLKVEIDQLRTAYKEALEILESSKRCQISITIPDWQNDRDKALTNPLAIEVMKEKKV